jgi:hypothetical protein
VNSGSFAAVANALRSLVFQESFRREPLIPTMRKILDIARDNNERNCAIRGWGQWAQMLYVPFLFGHPSEIPVAIDYKYGSYNDEIIAPIQPIR